MDNHESFQLRQRKRGTITAYRNWHVERKLHAVLLYGKWVIEW